MPTSMRYFPKKKSMLPSAVSIWLVLNAQSTNIESSLLEPDKPPPRLSFDLGAIEAFENKMDLEALDFVEEDNVEDTCCPAMKRYLHLLFQEPHNKQIDTVASCR
jgi:hypothetical protein